MKETANDDFVPKIFYCVLRKCSPHWRIQPHSVDRYDITYIIKGSARYTINGKIHELGPGDLICLNEGDEIEAITYPKNPMHCFSVIFNPLYATASHHPPPPPSDKKYRA
jgi:hypothetical protein